MSFQVQQRPKKILQSYKQVKCADINCYPQKLFVCSDGLWVAGYNQGVFVYNLDLDLIRHIEHRNFHLVTSVLKAPTGVIVCDSDTGIHHLNHQGDYTNLICSGCYSDASLTGDNKIYALDCRQGEIHTFLRNLNSWVKDTQFKLAEYRDGCDDDKMCTTTTHVYVSSCNTHCVLAYTLSGEFVYKAGECAGDIGKLWFPRLGDVDSVGKLLVCDFYGHRLQVFDTQSRVWCQPSGLEEMKAPVCAGVGDKHIWVGTGDYPYQLLQLEFTQ